MFVFKNTEISYLEAIIIIITHWRYYKILIKNIGQYSSNFKVHIICDIITL